MVTLTGGLIISNKITISMDFQPSAGISAKKLDRLGMDIRSFHEPLKDAVQKVVIPSIRRNFDSEGRPSWTPLAQRTVWARGSAHPILNRTGNLRRQMGYLKVWHIGREMAMIRDLPQSIWYGKVQQAGLGLHDVQEDFRYATSSTGKASQTPVSVGMKNLGEPGSIPPRPFVMIQAEDEPKIERIFQRWLTMRVKKAGL